MKRKEYKKPTMNVVQLQHQSQLLSGSSHETGVQNYNWHTEEEEE